MTREEFNKFVTLREEFKKKVEEFNKNYPEIKDEVLKLSDKTYDFPFAFVYNKKLDEITIDDNIKYIWVTDNPGLNEAIEEKYAVGSSGKGAQNFMVGSGMVEEYDKEVIVLNKSFLHTRVTNDLKKLKKYQSIIDETQIYMANLTLALLNIFKCPLWILGISSLNKIFSKYSSTLTTNSNIDMDKIYLYYHFSQGQFKKAYNKKYAEFPKSSPKELCKMIGKENRNRLNNT